MAWVCSVGAAAAAGDYDNDGWIDLYVTNSKKETSNFLYRNTGDGAFVDVAPKAGLAAVNDERGVSMDCVWGDFNNDGWIDLYLVRWGQDSLYRNNGDGTFTDVTEALFRKRDGSPGTDWANGNAAVWLDFNRDGRLDIYVGNYFDDHDLWRLQTTRIMHDDFETARNGGRNFIYRQESDGTFTETAAALGVDDSGWTLAVGAGDLNNDGWVDLYCADDFGPDQLFLNQRNGGFTNATEHALGYDTKKGMNVDIADFDNDGWLDIYVANITTAEYLQEGNMLWHNEGPSEDNELVRFIDISLETGVYDGGWGWGAKWFDADNDGDLDLVGANGFISAGEESYWYALASWTVTGDDSSDAKNWPPIGDASFSGYESLRFWRNDGPYLFTERSQELGLVSASDGRGVVCFDYDNDGDVDVFVANQGQAPQLFRNQSAAGHWLTVRLEAAPSESVTRGAIGTRVTIVSKGQRQIRERDGGNGYCGQSDPRLHFGLGKHATVDLMEIRWPDGGLQCFEDIPANQILLVRRDPQEYTSHVSLAGPQPKKWGRPRETEQSRMPELSAEELDQILARDEAAIREDLTSYRMASAYRERCAAYEAHDRAIEFFSELVESDPGNQRARLELACAYVDKIRTAGGMAAIVSKGTLARKSLDQLDKILEKSPNSWPALYARGMNHLHWPRALRHSAEAAADFERCLELQRKTESPNSQSYFARTHIALGDAYAKNKEFQKARAAWRRGLKIFPDSEDLKKRVALTRDDDLFEFVNDTRSLESPIDTDLSFLDARAASASH